MTRRQPKNPKRGGKSRHSDVESDDESHSFTSDTSHITTDSITSQQSRGSNASTASRKAKGEEEIVTSLEDQFYATVDEVEEKRASIRENALRRLVKLLSQKYLPDVLDLRIETVVDAMKRIIRREAVEGILAARVLSLCWLTHGANDDLYPGVARLLREVIKSGKAELRMACIDALAMISYMEGLDSTSTKELLQFFLGFVTPSTTPGITKSALDAYGLIYAQTAPHLTQESFNFVLDKHLGMLGSDDLDVRIAAGENIAVLFEEVSEDVSYDKREELLRELGGLSADSDKSKAKKERAVQRSAFRDIFRTVEEGNVAPNVNLKFKHESVDFDSWAKIKQLYALRTALADGMNVHFLENPLIQEIFDLSFDSAYVPMTSTERRLQETYVGKAKAKGLAGARGKRNVVTFDEYEY
ncbi:Interferon- developmental regulator 1 [Rhizophlyctis rosea]|nr:Interferon- developmental regulator 1 [Rhizophlyctis rosea]